MGRRRRRRRERHVAPGAPQGRTRAVEPLGRLPRGESGEPPETFPTGLESVRQGCTQHSIAGGKENNIGTIVGALETRPAVDA